MNKPGIPTEQLVRERITTLVDIANSLNFGIAEDDVDAQFHQTMAFSTLVQRGLESLFQLHQVRVLGTRPVEDFLPDQPTASSHIKPLLAVQQFIVPVLYQEIPGDQGPPGQSDG
jgi:hypothetical protein